LAGTCALVRDLFFTARTPQAVVDDCQAQLHDESYLAFLDMLVLSRHTPRLVETPMLVLGAEHDGFFTVRELRRTARAAAAARTRRYRADVTLAGPRASIS
jgi:hypothetical protein